MSKKKKFTGLLFPIAVVAFGVFLIVTKKASYGWATPEVEGPAVVLAGVLFCLLGFWACISTLRGKRAKEASPDAVDRVPSDFE